MNAHIFAYTHADIFTIQIYLLNRYIYNTDIFTKQIYLQYSRGLKVIFLTDKRLFYKNLLLWPKAITNNYDQMPEYFRSYRKGICSRRPP